MSTASKPRSSGNYADCDQFIEYQLTKARARIKWTDVLTALFWSGVLLVGYVLVFTLLDHWVVDGGFAPWTRAIMLALVLVGCVAIIVRFVVRPWLSRVNPLYAARVLDDADPEMKGTLLGLIDMDRAGKPAPEAIRRTMEKQAAVRLAASNMDEAIDRGALIRLACVLFGLVLLTCGYTLLSPKGISLLRPLTLSASTVATQTQIVAVKPGDLQMAAGSHVEVTAEIEGLIPDEVYLLYSTADDRFVDERVELRAATEDGRQFSGILLGDAERGIRQATRYRIVAGDTESREYTITVDLPPSAAVTQLHYSYPEYMMLSPRTVRASNIEAWEGTQVELTAESDQPLKKATLRFSDDVSFTNRAEELPMVIDGTSLSVNFDLKPREDGSFPGFYRIECVGEDGNQDKQPPVYTIDVRRDRAPLVQLLDPTRDQEVPSNAVVPLLIAAEDPDFRLRRITLEYEINDQPAVTNEPVFDSLNDGLKKEWKGIHEFRLETLDLQPGDVVRYFLQARDNKPPLGNRSRSAALNLHITDPIDEQEVNDQLARDREIQEERLAEEMQPQSGGEPENAEEQPSDTVDPADPATGESENPDDPESSSTDEPGTNGTEQQAGGEGRTGDQSGTDSNPQSGDPLDDDEALQKLIERMQRDADSSDEGEPGGGGESPEPSGPDDPSARPDAGGTGESPDNTTSTPGETEPTGSEGTESSNDPRLNSDNAGSDRTGNTDNNSDPRDPKSTDSGAPEDRENQDPGSDSNERNAGTTGSEDPAANADPPAGNESPTGTDPATAQNTEKPANEQSASTPDPGAAQNPDSQSADGDEAPQQTNQSQNSDPGSDGEGQKPNPENAGQQSGDSPGSDNQAQQNPSEQQGNPSGSEESQNASAANKAQKSNDPNGQESGDGQQDSQSRPSESGESGSDQQGDRQNKPSQQNDAGEGSQKSASGNEGSGQSQSGENSSGESSSGESQPGGQQPGGQKSGGESGTGSGKPGSGKPGGGDSADSASGAEGESGGDKSGDPQSGGKPSPTDRSAEGGPVPGESPQDSEKGTGGEASGGGQQSGGGESSADQNDGGEDRNADSPQQKSDPSSGGGQESAGSKQGGEQGGKQGGEQSGSEQSGGESGSEGSQGGSGAGDGQKQGFGGSGSNSSSDSEGGGAGSVGQGASGAMSDQAGGDQGDPQGEGAPARQNPQSPRDGQADSETKPDALNVEDAAQAADLAIRRLERELERGEISDELLEELGWSENDLREFTARMKEQLKRHSDAGNADDGKTLEDRRFEEMLRSLDLSRDGRTRQGDSEGNIDAQDTTIREWTVPPRYREWLEMYKRSSSGNQRNGLSR